MNPPAPSQAITPQPVVEYGARRILIVVGVMMAALLQTLDATIVNVALPTIEGNIGASIDDGTWIITGYIISNVIAIPLAPYLLQRLGRRQYFSLSIAGFTIASFFCGTATSLAGLVFYRVIQGLFGGGLIATSQIVLRETFPPEKLAASSALFAIALTVGPALGPTLGGILTDQYSWQWVFDINLIPGAIAAAIMLTMLKNPLPPRHLSLDVPGIGFLAIALGSLQYLLDEGERKDWFDDTSIIIAAISAVLGLAVFIAWELWGTRSPIVDLRIFRYGNVRCGILAALLLGFVVFGPIVLLPQYVQNVLHFTATLSGLLILTRALPVMLLTPFVARLAGRVDPRILLTAGYLLSSISFFFLSSRMATTSDFGSFVPLLILSGFGQAMLLVPLLVAVIGSVTPADSPKVSSFIALAVQLGGSITSTMLITIFDRRMYFHSLNFGTALRHSRLPFQHALTEPGGIARLSQLLTQQAANAGFADALLLLSPLAFVALMPVWLLRIQKAQGPVSIPAAE